MGTYVNGEDKLMKFVIWGVGSRGKRIAKFIGYDHINAFIDSNPSLLGTEYEGIPIIDIEKYLELYKDCFLVVSPFENKEIIDVLIEKQIYTYFLLDDCPPEILREELSGIDEMIMPDMDPGRAVIYGSSLYSILLWERYHSQGFDIPLLVHNDNVDSKWLSGILSSNVYYAEDYRIKSEDLLMQTIRCIPEIGGAERGDFYHVANYLEKFRHPELEKFKNIHKGQRCFIIGNGSSLTCGDLNKLATQNEICMGMNGIPLIFNDTIWRPNYYVCEDPKGMEEFGDMILGCTMSTIFVSDLNKRFLEKAKGNENIYSFHMIRGDYMPNIPFFSGDIVKSIYNGFTVMYVCMQIAVYMGFQEIYLLGADFDYSDGDTVEVKHFSDSYHRASSGVKPNACRKTENLLAYQAAREYADRHGIKIYNATRGGKLEVFERVDFDSLFSMGVGQEK